MKSNLRPIYQLKYIPAHLITDYKENLDGTVELATFEPLRPVIFATGSQSFQSVGKPTKSGMLYTSSIAASLRDPISYIGPGILFVRLSDDTILVFGDPEIPIYLNHTHTDQVRSFNLDYDSPKPLLKLKVTATLWDLNAI
jgi:hypothetical protein